MPLFYIHILQEEDVLRDTEGSEFPDVATALAEAMASARELLARRILADKPVGKSAVELLDANGSSLALVPFAELIRFR